MNEGRGIDLRPMPFPYRAAGRLLSTLRMKPYPMDPERIKAAAARDAGLPPRFGDFIEEALDRLCHALREEAALHWFGRANLWELMVTGLSSRLQLDELYRQSPELERTPLTPPLIVLGLPRSGTTFLHRLLADTDDARAMCFFEHLRPLPPKGLDLRRFRTELKFAPWRHIGTQYNLDSIHYVRPGEADECNFSLRLSMRSTIFWSLAPTHSYLHWLLGQDLRETYRTYRRVLLCMQRQNPGCRMTLKCPSHSAFLPALTEAIPEAMLIQTHRAPESIIASESSLMLALQATSVETLDWRRSVQTNIDKVAAYADRSADFADTEAGRAVLHVDYRRLVSESVTVAREIREHFGLGFGPGHARRLEHYARDNRQHKRGRHRYSMQKYELDPEDIERRFAKYRERFAEWLP